MPFKNTLVCLTIPRMKGRSISRSAATSERRREQRETIHTRKGWEYRSPAHMLRTDPIAPFEGGRTDGILFRWVWLPSSRLAELCRFRGCPGELENGSSPTKVEKGIQGGVRPSAGPGSHVAIVPANSRPLGLFYRLPRSPGAAVSTPPSALRFQSRLVDCTRSWGER